MLGGFLLFPSEMVSSPISNSQKPLGELIIHHQQYKNWCLIHLLLAGLFTLLLLLKENAKEPDRHL